MENVEWFHLTVFYGSFLVFPFLAAMFWLWRRGWRFWAAVGLLLSLLFIYMRFVEPKMILTHDERRSGDLKVMVVADFHLGLYKGEDFLARVVAKVNAADPDLVLIAGDFVYAMREEDLAETFAPLADLTAPTFAVLGNHDLISSNGEFEQEEMEAALGEMVTVLDDEAATIEVKGEKLRIVGLRDYWTARENYGVVADLLAAKAADERLILLIHNPDELVELERRGLNEGIDLAAAGHTHGGQIRLPGLYKKAIPTEYPFDKGWYEIGGTPLFVTAGLGETALPLRFLVPPRVDLISL